MRHGFQWRILQAGPLLLAFVLCSGCQSFPSDALQAKPDGLADRAMQTRLYNTPDEAKMLSACSALLQDTGFTIEASDPTLGFITATKTREVVMDSEQTVKLAGLIAMAYLLGDPSMLTMMEKEQEIQANVVTRPVDEGRTAVRVTFRRIMRPSDGTITTITSLKQPDLYQEYFSQLSKSVFLEEQEL